MGTATLTQDLKLPGTKKNLWPRTQQLTGEFITVVTQSPMSVKNFDPTPAVTSAEQSL